MVGTKGTMSSPRGRKKDSASPLEKQAREAARRLKDFHEIQEQVNELMGFDRDMSDERRAELEGILDKRLSICMKMDRATDQIKSLKDMSDEDEVERVKDARKALHAELKALPELGYTYEEWKLAPDHLKEDEPGRPKLRIEQRLNRARLAFRVEEEKLRAMEAEEGTGPTDLEKVRKELAKSSIGRSRLSPAERLDRQAMRYMDEINYIASGLAEKEAQESLQQRMEEAGVFDPSKLPGRKPVPASTRIANFRKKKADVDEKILAIEGAMTSRQLARRRISQAKAYVQHLETQLGKAKDPSLRDIVSSQLDHWRKEQRKCEAQLSSQQSHAETDLARTDVTKLASQETIADTRDQSSDDDKRESARPKRSEILLEKDKQDIRDNARKQADQKMASDRRAMEAALEEMMNSFGISNKPNEESRSRSSLAQRLMKNASNG